MMYTFTYPFIQKLIYRYGNIPINLMLIFHIIFSFYMISEEWYFPIYILFNLAILFIVNKYFFKTYKLFPFKITANNEKIICENFFLSKKKIEIYHQNINKIRGGIFSGYLTRPIYIIDDKQNITIGFYPHAGNFNKLLTIILQNIPQKLYNDLIKEITTRGTDTRFKRKTKKPVN
ncbi:hypothetical protein ABRY23_12670 [Melioribacteraceae bacterium 4301-Me]|uniref:hypothetical protein n=1 Tax=Pyranulibacter aquaticus TaxID=3163344 RepID=UPI00359ACC07